MMRYRVIHCLFLCPALAVAGHAQMPGPPKPSEVPTALASAPRLGVDVRLGESSTLRFLVDTASTRSVIATDVAQKYQLKAGPEVKVQNIGGADKTPSAIIPELAFANILIKDIQAPALLRSNLDADGLLGLDVLRNQRMTIDFLHDTRLTIVPSQKNAPVTGADDPGTIVVRAKSRFGELIVTNAEIEGQRVAVIIDTGSEDSIGNSALRALVSRRIAHTEIRPTILLSVTGREVPGEYTQIGRVDIGGVQIANLPIVFADVTTFKQFGLAHKPAILLGMETLRLVDKVTLDFPYRTITFVLARHANAGVSSTAH